MIEKKFHPGFLAVIVVLCVGVAALFLLSPAQTESGPEVSFETISPEDVPEIVRGALTPPDPHIPPDQIPDLSGAVAGNVAVVCSLPDDVPRFYLVPFMRDGSGVAIGQVYLQEDGRPEVESWTKGVGDLTAWGRPCLANAKDALRDAGYHDGKWAVRWVEMNSEQSIGPYFWEFKKETGETVYVGYNRYEDLIQVYTTVTPKTKGGG